MTLSLLSTTPSSVITRFDSFLSESTFIQYNSARLKAIINRYNEEFVNNSVNNSVNTSLLTHDLEWNLIFNHFSNYQTIINSFNDFIESSDKTVLSLNHLILFLKNFVSDVSVYYKKVKILTEPSPHLLSLIGARIHLCEVLLKLLINCLNIFQLETVNHL